MPLELGSLKNAVGTLNGVLGKSDDGEFMRGLDEITRNAIKFGAIHNFTVAYELCWKLIKLWLETNISPTTAEGVTRRQLFRLAAENRLIADVDRWMRHHDARSLTFLMYEPAIAEGVYLAVHDFARDAQRLLEALEVRND